MRLRSRLRVGSEDQPALFFLAEISTLEGRDEELQGVDDVADARHRGIGRPQRQIQTVPHDGRCAAARGHRTPSHTASARVGSRHQCKRRNPRDRTQCLLRRRCQRSRAIDSADSLAGKNNICKPDLRGRRRCRDPGDPAKQSRCRSHAPTACVLPRSRRRGFVHSSIPRSRWKTENSTAIGRARLLCRRRRRDLYSGRGVDRTEDVEPGRHYWIALR